MSSEQKRLDRFDRAMSRLMQAHRDALGACEGVLDDRDERPPVGDDEGFVPEDLTILGTLAPPLDAAASRSEGGLYRTALEDVRTVLLSASEDVQAILGEGDEGGG